MERYQVLEQFLTNFDNEKNQPYVEREAPVTTVAPLSSIWRLCRRIICFLNIKNMLWNSENR